MLLSHIRSRQGKTMWYKNTHKSEEKAPVNEGVPGGGTEVRQMVLCLGGVRLMDVAAYIFCVNVCGRLVVTRNALQ